MTIKSKSTPTPAPPSRRSTRVAGKLEPVKNGQLMVSKKRPTNSNSDTKPIPTKKSKPSPTSSKSASKEKKAEAPPSSKPETGGKGILKLGDKLPKIILKDHEDSEIDVSGLTSSRGIVLFLYPKADTPGCTTQACGFRDVYDEIVELGYDVYGLSKDKPAAQKKWATKKELTYKLLCDPESKLIKRLGAFVQPNNTKRSHFIFEKGTGKLLEAAIGVKPKDDPENCLKFIKAHQ